MTQSLTKSTALRLLREFDFPLLPETHVPLSDRASFGDRLLRQWPHPGDIVLRTSGDSSTTNLPRLVAVSPAAGIEWALELPADIRAVIVLPFARVDVSIELRFLTSGRALVEMLPGIWELDAVGVPTVVGLSAAMDEVSIHAPCNGQLVRYVESDRKVVWRKADVEDWQVNALVNWIVGHSSKLRELFDFLNSPYTMRIHLVDGYGFVAQNLRIADSEIREEPNRSTESNCEALVVNSIGTIPTGTTDVVLAVSVAREDFDELQAFFQYLWQQGVRRLHLRSGLLSHLAILAREAGFETIRAEPGIQLNASAAHG